MSAIIILILVSLVVALGFLAAYIWAVRGGQYDDTETPSMRILMDEDPAPQPSPHGPAPTPAAQAPDARNARP